MSKHLERHLVILIVDDEPHVRDALVRIITSMGHATCWAATGKGALRLMRSEKPDLVILDMMMPEMDGWGVLREKDIDGSIRQIPTLILSGLTPEQVRQGGNVLENAVIGAQLILSKPIDYVVLLSAIKHLCDGQSK